MTFGDYFPHFEKNGSILERFVSSPCVIPSDSPDLSQRHQVVTLPGSNIQGNTASSTTGTTPFPNGTSIGGEFPSSVTGDSVEMESRADTQGEAISLSITISVEDDTGQINTMDLDEETGMQHTGTSIMFPF